MTHPELKAALIEALEKLDAAFPESQANQILSKVDFTPTREQVLRSPETEAIANDFAYFLIGRMEAHTNSTLDEMDHWEDFKGKQLSALTPEPESLIGRKVDDHPRFFVDKRPGCIAVRDRLHPDFDPSYQGLHFDTVDVIYYSHGVKAQDGWVMADRDVKKAHSVCDHLNSLLPASEIHAHLVDEPQTYPDKTAVGPVLTEAMAVRVCKKLDEMGKKWLISGSYLHTSNWAAYKEGTYYGINEGTCGSANDYKGYTLITPEEFLGVEAEASVKQDVADLKRIVSEGQKLIEKLETK